MVELYKTFKVDKLPNFIESQISIFCDSLDSSKSFQQKIYPFEFETRFNQRIIPYLKKTLKNKDIIFSDRACLNFVKNNGTSNSMAWHNENGIKNGIEGQVDLESKYDCIFWWGGEKNKGGNLKIIHDLTSEIISFPFEPLSFIIITKDTLHSVENYFGDSYRISFNIDFNLK